jgi:hypothetical protein
MKTYMASRSSRHICPRAEHRRSRFGRCSRSDVSEGLEILRHGRLSFLSSLGTSAPGALGESQRRCLLKQCLRNQPSERRRGRRERRLVQTGAEDFGLPTTRGFQSDEKRPGLTNSVSLRGVTFEGDLDLLDGERKHGLGTPFPDQRRGGDSDAREVLEEGSLLRQALHSGLSAHVDSAPSSP